MITKEVMESKLHMQRDGCIRCPRCGQRNMDFKLHRNALSRRADVYICSQCGTDEALEDAGLSTQLSLDDWEVSKIFRM